MCFDIPYMGRCVSVLLSFFSAFSYAKQHEKFGPAGVQNVLEFSRNFRVGKVAHTWALVETGILRRTLPPSLA